jgi:hypothetical protein
VLALGALVLLIKDMMEGMLHLVLLRIDYLEEVEEHQVLVLIQLLPTEETGVLL